MLFYFEKARINFIVICQTLCYHNIVKLNKRGFIMKKVLSLFLSVLMLTSVVAAVDLSAYAASFSGTCGDNLTWELDDDAGILTISGSGNMYDYDTRSSVPWSYKREYIKTVILNDGITSIGDWAFYDFFNLTNVTLPGGIISIGTRAFGDCVVLTNVTIPESVVSIGDFAFCGCSELKDISIPASVTSLGRGAFDSCTSLTDITLPGNIETMGTEIFKNCTNLTKATIKSGITYINNSTFSCCSKLTDVSIPETITYIGGGAFSDCKSLTQITLPKNLSSIEMSTFSLCSALSGITIPKNVTSIGQGAFSSCKSLKSIAIPDSVTSIGDAAFESCSGLTSVTIGSGVQDIGSNAFSECTSLKSIVIPDNVKNIQSMVFLNCISLTEITIGKGIKSILLATFSGCSKLNCIYYTGTKNAWGKISISEDSNEYFLHAPVYCTDGKIATTHTWKVTTKGDATNKKSGKFVCSVCGSTKKLYYPKTMSLSTSSYTYNAKAKKPSVTIKDSNGSKISSKYYTVSYINQSTGKKVSSMKNPGKYYVKVTFKTRYSGSLKKAVTIKPKKTSIKSVKASSKGFTVKWGKVSTQNTGYQVQYSTSKSFKNAKTATIKKTGTTSKKVTKLKAKKKYYVRVRTYKTVKINGKSTKIYSAWSSVKGVTTKK